MTTGATLKVLAKLVRLSSEFGRNKGNAIGENMNGYRCTLQYKGRQYSFDFFQGYGIEHDPDVDGVLDCLLSDSQAGGQTFEEFCGDFGYDPDSRKAEATHKACVKVLENMQRLLGDDFETFLYADRN